MVLVVGVWSVADNGRKTRDMMSSNESLICLRAAITCFRRCVDEYFY